MSVEGIKTIIDEAIESVFKLMDEKKYDEAIVLLEQLQSQIDELLGYQDKIEAMINLATEKSEEIETADPVSSDSTFEERMKQYDPKFKVKKKKGSLKSRFIDLITGKRFWRWFKEWINN